MLFSKRISFVACKFSLALVFTFFSFNCFSHPAPIVNYYLSEFCFGDTAYFTNTTTRATSYEWNVYEQDAVNDTLYNLIYRDTIDVNLKYLFLHKGKFQVELIGYNGHVVAVKRLIIIDSQTVSNFAYQDCGSQLVNLSVCYSSCHWDFGDGTTSTEISPIHYFPLTGRYKVTLTAVGPQKTDIFSDSITVNEINNICAKFTYKVLKDSVHFLANDSVLGPFAEYYWAFGDGTVVDLFSLNGGRKVYHSYVRKDTNYTVFLLIKTLCIASFANTNIFIPDSTPVYGTSVFPNPLSGSVLTLESERKKDLQKITVLNSTGKSFNFIVNETTKGYKIDIGDIPKGLYFISVYFNDEAKKYKILKE